MREALAAYEIAGLQTNVEFLGRLMTAPAYVDANLDTALIERERVHLFPERGLAPRRTWDLAVLALVNAQLAARPIAGNSPWDARDGWRLVGHGARHWKMIEGQQGRDVEIEFLENTILVTIDGDMNIVSGELVGGRLHANIDMKLVTAGAFVMNDDIHVFVDGAHRHFRRVDPYVPHVEHADAHGGLRAPMPGRILAVMVAPGAAVKRGAPLVVMEAMKMEHTIVAPTAGTVDRVLCSVGEQVTEGAELLQFRLEGT
jgi:3-methylcrotonyl-CoA carboxylase alpha subunit